MAAYSRVYDSRHLQTAKNWDQLQNHIRSATGYGLPFPFLLIDLDNKIAITGGVVKA